MCWLFFKLETINPEFYGVDALVSKNQFGLRNGGSFLEFENAF